MTAIDTVVIGAGHAGLAVSRLLTVAGHDHVVLDRGRVGRELAHRPLGLPAPAHPELDDAPPGWAHTGPDPDGFLCAAEFVDYLEGYAGVFGAAAARRYAVEEASRSTGPTAAATASSPTGGPGARATSSSPPDRTARPNVPAGLPRVHVLTAGDYRNPAQLAEGGVLVVGASASGVQIADELLGPAAR